MLKHSVRNKDSRSRIYLSLLLVAVIASPIAGRSLGFTVPADVALRIRLDDTLTSNDSQVGDPFSATVVDRGEYRNARVYGHISSIKTSGRLKGNTTMMLRFDRLVMPDGRRARLHLSWLSFMMRRRERRSTSRGRSNLAGEAEKVLFTPRLARGPERCLAAYSVGAKGPASTPSLVALVGSEPRRSTGAKRSR
jgi:hypothetical protein